MSKSKKLFVAISFIVFLFFLSLCFIINPSISNLPIDECSFLLTYIKIVFLLSLLFLIVLLYLILFTKTKIEKIVFLMILFFGFLYILVITPLSAPDELHHYKSTYILVNDILKTSDISYGYAQDFDFSGYQLHHNVMSGYIQNVKHIFSSRIVEDTLIKIDGPFQYNYPLEYIFPAIGMLAGRLLNLNIFWIYSLGRLTNLIGYAICVYFAIKRIPKFKLMLAIVALFPMSLQQASSYSYDSIINGTFFLFLSSIIYSIYAQEKFTLKELLWILIPGLINGPVKAYTGLIVFAILLIPESRFNKRWQKYAILVPCLLCIALFAAIGYFKWPTKVVGYAPKDPVKPVKVKYSLDYIVTNPIGFLQILINSIKYWYSRWIAETIGYLLSGLSLYINKILIILFGLLAIVATYVGNSDVKIKVSTRVTFLLISFVIVMVLLIMMFKAETKVGSTYIKGIQGRYFIPVVPLVLISTYINKIEIKKSIENHLLVLTSIISILVVYDIVYLTLHL